MFASSLVAVGLHVLFGSISIQSNVCQPPDLPSINTPVNGASVTAGTNVVVQGVAMADTTVTLKDNGTTYASVTADQSSTFAAQTQFDAGQHTLAVVSSNPCGTNTGTPITITAKSTPVTPPNPPVVVPEPPSTSPSPVVTLPIEGSGETLPPTEPSKSGSKKHHHPTQSGSATLMLTNLLPQNGAATSQSSIFVTGNTNLLATEAISVGGKTVASSEVPRSSFGMSVPLAVGKNEITITATSAGGQTSATISVERTKPASSSNSPNIPWYKTTPGKVAIGTSFLLILLVFFMVSVW